VNRTIIKRTEALGLEFTRKIVEIGIRGTLKHIAFKLTQIFRDVWRSSVSCSDEFDTRYGTDTAKIVGVWALDIPHNKLEHAIRYETLAPDVFSESLGQLQISHQEFIFIDLGSGKGRALLLASRLPFKEIIGVELSSRLDAIAAQNIRLFKDDTQKCRNIKTICKDAMDYHFPDENVVLYLYNPFDEQVMQSVLAKVEEFILRNSREVFVLYHHPLHANVWNQSRCLQMVKNNDKCLVYAAKKRVKPCQTTS
jgi:SAM-dependent methyltransferase